MENLLNTFLLFIAAIVALLSYLLIPKVPVTALMTAAAILLAAGVWWHATQFGVDYRTSTWQEQLRNYASYALLLVVFLLSYAFYVFGWQGSSLSEAATRAYSNARNAVGRAASRAANTASRGLSAASSAATALVSEGPVESGSISGAGSNLGRTNILM